MGPTRLLKNNKPGFTRKSSSQPAAAAVLMCVLHFFNEDLNLVEVFVGTDRCLRQSRSTSHLSDR